MVSGFRFQVKGLEFRGQDLGFSGVVFVPPLRVEDEVSRVQDLWFEFGVNGLRFRA